MKKKYKEFLRTCNLDLEDQLCDYNEYKIVRKLVKKGLITNIVDAPDNPFGGGFYMNLTKKGLKKAIKFS